MIKDNRYHAYLDKVVRAEREEALQKALTALSQYKFYMFGYWAAVWVKMNKLDPRPQPNPFHDLVKIAKVMKEGKWHGWGT